MQEKKPAEEVPIRYLKGVGPKKAEVLERLGIFTARDLLFFLPRRYEDRSEIVSVKDLRPGDVKAVVGKVMSSRTFRAGTGTVITEAAVGEGTSRVFAVWYNQPYIKKFFTEGAHVMLYGRVDLQKRLQIVHPAFEVFEEGGVRNTLDIGRIVPIYRLTEGVNQKYMRKVVHGAITSYARDIQDPLPTGIRARRKLADMKFAVENIHFPCSNDNLEKAYRRLVFEEFFLLQTVMAKRRLIRPQAVSRHEVKNGMREELGGLLGFEFTESQKKCMSDIERDMSSEKPMFRLLQGDVGSGKTAVAMYATLLSVRGGRQAAVMAPTEILARQHFLLFSEVLMPLGMNIRLLVSGMDASQKEIVKNEIVSGEAAVIIGTHSMIQGEVDFKDLGVVVVDEQHKFGVEQGKALVKKGKMPDTLIMTATPIPRSLALTLYGDMDISVLKEKPAGREDVVTYWVGEEKRDSVYKFISDEVRSGRQAFIVYPRIDDKGRSELLSASEMAERLENKIFPSFRVALLHGRLSSQEKERIMREFAAGMIDILAATTVVEVGIDVPNVTVMVVENADRYGLAQLHQLRGRIGRGKHQSYCILLADDVTEEACERLEVVTRTGDGFEIAEKDLDLRGPGEFLGTRQSGLPELKVGNIVRDISILEEAREEAFAMVTEDPDLSDERHAGIKKAIKERFSDKYKI